ncbi:MAG: TIGR00180 family glycosyltransferase [Elusimicrobia bacterium]|nr:TIGR00180 family glycosyltransferase [Elusimicrobiota bacterium]
MSDLTLVVPLRGRTRYTRRWLAYADSERLPFRILLADGSAEEDAQAHRDMARPEAWPRLRLEYRRYPEDAGLPQFWAKLADALGRVSTPFAALVDNDDFSIASGLERCVAFLRKNPGHSACGGLVAGMSLGAGGPRFEPRPSPGNLDDGSAAERLRRHFQAYQVTWYDPARQGHLAGVFAELAKRGLRDFFLAELLASQLLAARGPIRKLPDLMLVRQYDVPGAASGSMRQGGPLDRMLAPTWSEDFGRFTDALVEALSAAGCDPVDARSLVRDGYRGYIEKGLRRGSSGAAGASRLRALIPGGLRRSALVTRAKNRRWAGPEGVAALERIREFLGRPEGTLAA